MIKFHKTLILFSRKNKAKNLFNSINFHDHLVKFKN